MSKPNEPISDERVNGWLRKARLKLHPWAAVIPRMSAEQFEAFKEDVKKLGRIREPIWLKDKHLVDGLHRLGACIESEIEPRYEEYPDDDLVEFINSKNLHRRHLTKEQWRALHKRLVPEIEKQLNEKAEKEGEGIVSHGAKQIRGRGRPKGTKHEAVEQAAKLTDKSPATVYRNIAEPQEPKPEQSKYKPKTEMPWEDGAHKKWTRWINKFPHEERGQIYAMMREWTAWLNGIPASERVRTAAIVRDWLAWCFGFKTPEQREQLSLLVYHWIKPDIEKQKGAAK